MAEIACVSEVELRRMIVQRLAAAHATAPLSCGVVRDAAVTCGVSERTMWRWIARGDPAVRAPRGVLASERAVELLLQWRGNVAAVHRQLLADGETVPCRQTLGRAFERALSPIERDFARRGEPALRDRAVYLRHEARFRGECYEADHKQLSIEVLAPRAQRPRRPWVTLFEDQFSRLIVGWAISLRPTQAEVLAALRMAVTVDPERGGFGGVPVMLRWDRGLEFAANSIEQATLALGCVSRRTEAYSPWKKGKIAHADQTPASTAAVKRLHDLGRGVVVVYPTPGRGGEGIARDILQALGKQFRDRTPRDPRKLETLAVLWLRAERVAELLIAAAERRPADDWRLLRRLCGETRTRLTMIVEQPASDHHVAALGGDVRELTLAELAAETPVTPEDVWGIFDRSGSPDDRPGYPPVPDVDFALFPSACRDVLLQHDAGWAVSTFDQARRATMLWLELRATAGSGVGAHEDESQEPGV